MSSCPRCVRPVPPDATHCPNCAYDIHGTEQPAPTAAPTAAATAAPYPVAEVPPEAAPTRAGVAAAAAPADQTGLIAHLADEDSDLMPAFAEGSPPIAEPAERQRRDRRSIAGIVVAGLAALAVIAAVTAGRMGHRDAANATSNKTGAVTQTRGSRSGATSSSASGGGATRSANRQRGLAQASTIAGYLAHSGRARREIGAAITAISGCTDITSSVTTLQNAADVRTRIVAALASTRVGRLPHGAAAIAELGRAMRASANADLHYAAWGQAVAGCHGHAPRGAEFVAAQRFDSRATTIKQRFVEEWNPIAARYGLAKQSAYTI